MIGTVAAVLLLDAAGFLAFTAGVGIAPGNALGCADWGRDDLAEEEDVSGTTRDETCDHSKAAGPLVFATLLGGGIPMTVLGVRRLGKYRAPQVCEGVLRDAGRRDARQRRAMGLEREV